MRVLSILPPDRVDRIINRPSGGHLGSLSSGYHRLVMLQRTSRHLLHCSAAGILAIAIASAIGGCGADPQPAAASNEDFTGSGLESASNVIDDRWASVVLDASQRAEVRDILRGAVSGETVPLGTAVFGIRFEDVPRAILTAAPTVEMAVMRQAFIPAIASVTFRDAFGQEAVASIDLGRMTALSTVRYLVPGDDVARPRSRMLDAINGLLWSDGNFFAGSTAHRLASARAEVEGVEALRILKEAVEEAGGTLLSSAFEPEKYEIDLLMLDDEPARLEVRREPDPRVLSWTAHAGTFSSPEKASDLGSAFEKALREWGRTPMPAETRDVATEKN